MAQGRSGPNRGAIGPEIVELAGGVAFDAEDSAAPVLESVVVGTEELAVVGAGGPSLVAGDDMVALAAVGGLVTTGPLAVTVAQVEVAAQPTGEAALARLAGDRAGVAEIEVAAAEKAGQLLDRDG